MHLHALGGPLPLKMRLNPSPLLIFPLGFGVRWVFGLVTQLSQDNCGAYRFGVFPCGNTLRTNDGE